MPVKPIVNTTRGHKQKARGGLWIVVILVALFSVIIFRFATTGTAKISLFNGLPSSGQAYEMAQEFIRPTLHGSKVTFNDDGFQFGKKSDSVYVIKSFVETASANGEHSKQYFTVILKYKGGAISHKSNWELLDMSSN